MALSRDARILSRPVPVHWAGWESTTTDLQRAGWKLAVEFDDLSLRYRLLMHFEKHHMWGFSSAARYEFYISDPNYSADIPPFYIINFTTDLHVHNIGLNLARVMQIDAEPQVAQIDIRSAKDLNIFALARDKAKEILVDRADMSVVEHLEAIQKLQAPKQAELRAKIIREREAKPLSLIAQIIQAA